MPRKTFVAGEILTAADVNTNLMDQAVMVFDDSAARGSAIPSPSEGMVTYLKDTDAVEKYTTDWEPVNTQGILQVVSTTKTDVFSTTSTSFTGVTGLTATITPTSTSSKILILVSMSLSDSNTSGSNQSISARLTGGNAGTFIGDAAGNRTRASAAWASGSFFQLRFSPAPTNLTFLDSPATTSPVTYGVDVQRDANASTTLYVNRASSDLDFSYFSRVASSITVMEVAG
jgi:hypothetical protein